MFSSVIQVGEQLQSDLRNIQEDSHQNSSDNSRLIFINSGSKNNYNVFRKMKIWRGLNKCFNDSSWINHNHFSSSMTRTHMDPHNRKFIGKIFRVALVYILLVSMERRYNNINLANMARMVNQRTDSTKDITDSNKVERRNPINLSKLGRLLSGMYWEKLGRVFSAFEIGQRRCMRRRVIL
jgi:hypothetical protein